MHCCTTSETKVVGLMLCCDRVIVVDDKAYIVERGRPTKLTVEARVETMTGASLKKEYNR